MKAKAINTLLFIHGLANYGPVWKHQLAGLSKTLQVHCDRPSLATDIHPAAIFRIRCSFTLSVW
jgi:hypothetical protein